MIFDWLSRHQICGAFDKVFITFSVPFSSPCPAQHTKCTSTSESRRKSHFCGSRTKGRPLGQCSTFLNIIFDSQSSDTNSFACCLTEVQEKGPSCKSLWPAQLQTTALNCCYITLAAGLYNTSLWQHFFGCLKKSRPEMKDRSLKGEIKKKSMKSLQYTFTAVPLCQPLAWRVSVDPRNRAPAAEIVLSLCQAGGTLKHQVRHR